MAKKRSLILLLTDQPPEKLRNFLKKYGNVRIITVDEEAGGSVERPVYIHTAKSGRFSAKMLLDLYSVGFRMFSDKLRTIIKIDGDETYIFQPKTAFTGTYAVLQTTEFLQAWHTFKGWTFSKRLYQVLNHKEVTFSTDPVTLSKNEALELMRWEEGLPGKGKRGEK